MKQFLFIILFFPILTQAQDQASLDALLETWGNESQTDTARVLAYQDYIWYKNLFSDPDSAKILIKKMFDFCTEKKYVEGQSAALNLMGIAEAVKGNYYKAVKHYEGSLDILEKIGDEKAISASLNNIGNIYMNHGQYVRSLAYYEKALKLADKKDNDENYTAILISIGSVYIEQGNLDKALEYSEKALIIAQKKKIQASIASSQMNMAIVYEKKNQLNRSIKLAKQSLAIQEKLNNRQGVAAAYMRIGENYRKLGNLDMALSELDRAIETAKQVGDKPKVVEAKVSQGMVYLEQKKYAQALRVCEVALRRAKRLTLLKQRKDACKCLFEGNKAIGNGAKALGYYEQMNMVLDSLQIEETATQLQKIEFAKQLEHDSLVQARKELATQLEHQSELNKKNRTRNIMIGLAILGIVLAIGFYSRVKFIRRAKAQIEHEKDASDNLLLNILPEEIAKELKEKGEAEARDFKDVSILFTDFKEFTSAAEKMSAKELVKEINYIFKHFDHICEKYKIEKIKTIGDSYMAAGGLPVPYAQSAENTVKAAIEMANFVEERKKERLKTNSIPFEMRTGIHTGDVVAGIVGVKKFQYDIWGDTVNIASRVESSGEIGKVNISHSTHNFIKSNSAFQFKERGKIAAKGKGDVEMYFVDLA